jgi:4a-hydroxytetrahydrobiopterin dehydratase
MVPVWDVISYSVITPYWLQLQKVEQLKMQLCPSWAFVDEGRALERSFVAKDFLAAVSAVNGYAQVAEKLGHHPDLHITQYRTVTIRYDKASRLPLFLSDMFPFLMLQRCSLFTHALGGLSINDFVVAAHFDNEVKVVYSPQWLKDHPDVRGSL